MASKLISQLSKQELVIAKLIIEHYQALGIEQRDCEDAFAFTENESVYRVVKAASAELGFLNHDAQCIALAWQKKCPNLGQFQLEEWPNHLSLFSSYQPSSRSFASCPKKLGLYVIAPSAEWIKKLAQAGVQTLQLRFKSEDPSHIDEEVHQAIEAVKNYSCRLFINDHWQSALKYEAYGVHLGQEDLSVADLQKIQEKGLRLGLSSHGYAEMIRAANIQPSYIALGAIFPTTLKKIATAPQGLGRLQKYTELLKEFSLVGIGGVDTTNIKSVLDCGVGSVAMVRAVTAAKDYLTAIAQLNQYFQST